MGKPRDLANVVATGNILADGAVAPAELTGVTSTAAEINILDGVTATAAELNLLDGVTATTAELNYVDGVTSNVQTQMDTKAPVASPTFTGTVTGPTINASTALQIGGVAVTATAAELNKMDGVTVSASDINSVTAKAPAASPSFTGNVGIGTSSPTNYDGEADDVVIESSDHTGLTIASTGTDKRTNLYFSDGTSGTAAYIGGFSYDHSNNSLLTRTGGTERMRIDTSGNILVGHTSQDTPVDNGGAGVTLRPQGIMLIGGTGTSIYANREDSDGEIVQFRKDGTTVGNISTVSGNIKVSAYGEEYASLSGTSVTIDCKAGNNFALTTSGNTTFTFSNVPTSGTAFGFTLKLTAGGSHTITYPNSVDFAGGTAPDAPASGETDILVFYTVDGGTNWYGALAIDAAG